MSLSGNSRENVKVFQAILEIAEGIKELTRDPAALQKAVKDAYALPEAEEKKLAESKKLIDESSQVAKVQQDKQKKLEEMADALDERDSALVKKLDAVRKQEELLLAKEAKLTAITQKHDELVSDLSRRENELKAGIGKLSAEREALERRADVIATKEASIKDRAAKLKGLTEGL